MRKQKHTIRVSKPGGNNGGRGGFASMPIIQCVRCGIKFHIGNHNPRRECANRAKCDARAAKKAGAS